MGNKRYFKVNQKINADTVRVVNDEGDQLGVMSFEEALEEAKKRQLDLVEVAPKAEPPVTKITDFRKFLDSYLKRTSRRRTKSGQDMKQIRLKPFVDDHDLQVKIDKMREFLAEDDNKVKVTVRFFGRAIKHKDIGRDVMDKIIDKLSDVSRVEYGPTFKGKNLVLQLTPNKK